MRNLECEKHETLPISLWHLRNPTAIILWFQCNVIANDCWKMQSAKVKWQFSHLSIKMILFSRLVGFWKVNHSVTSYYSLSKSLTVRSKTNEPFPKLLFSEFSLQRFIPQILFEQEFQDKQALGMMIMLLMIYQAQQIIQLLISMFHQRWPAIFKSGLSCLKVTILKNQSCSMFQKV